MQNTHTQLTRTTRRKPTPICRPHIRINPLKTLRGIINTLFHPQCQKWQGKNPINPSLGLGQSFQYPSGDSTLMTVAEGYEGDHCRGETYYPCIVVAGVVVANGLGCVGGFVFGWHCFFGSVFCFSWSFSFFLCSPNDVIGIGTIRRMYMVS